MDKRDSRLAYIQLAQLVVCVHVRLCVLNKGDVYFEIKYIYIYIYIYIFVGVSGVFMYGCQRARLIEIFVLGVHMFFFSAFQLLRNDLWPELLPLAIQGNDVQ